MEKKNSHPVSIDLGTSNSVLAVMNKSGIIEVLPNMDGDLITNSIVSVAGDEPAVGKAAKPDKIFAPKSVAELFKRQMGAVTKDGEAIPVITAANGIVYTAIMLSAVLLRYLREGAEKLRGYPITQAVITVPAYFERNARLATKEAGRIGGFEDVLIVSEPTAAATYYGLSKGIDQVIAVFDFGGGTFDISILRIGAKGEITEIAIDGNPECGGSNIDEVLFQKVLKYLKSKGIELDPDQDLADWLELLDACRDAKEALSRKEKAIIPIRVKGQRLSMDITRKQLVEWSSQVINTLRECCLRALSKENLTGSDIDKVVLVGGSTRLPFISGIIRDIFGQEPVGDVDPDLAVAKGAAILGAAHFAAPDTQLMVEGIRYIAGDVKTNIIAGRNLCVAAITHKNGAQDKEEYNCSLIPSGARLPFEAAEHFTPISAGSDQICVKLIDAEPGLLSSGFTPLQEVDVAVQPTSEDRNRDRIEFKVRMDTEGLVDIAVRDKVLNKPVPITLKFHTSISEDDIKEKRRQLEAGFNN